MRVAYIAKHGSGGTDDEGAIEYALKMLGCDVVRVNERSMYPKSPWDPERDVGKVDLVLFHHWHDCQMLAKMWSGIKKVCWCFDLIDWPQDLTLEPRSVRRREWMGRVTSVVDHCFMSDGDWVAKDTTGKLHWLPQGADERIVGRDESALKTHDILFTGIGLGGGAQRESFVLEMIGKYGGRLNVINKGVYREELRQQIGQSRIVVAPDSPVTERYWSNRAYNTLGFGGFLLHPYCEKLAEQYEDGREIVYYDDRQHMHKLVDWYLQDDAARTRIGQQALERTRAQHTYRRRCEILLATVQGANNA